ncbi:hypothetical protein ACFFQW_01685 [Umezawaea endophytica]|uniref:NB-ARC domain-containing protein n=1 Tax=Umezawaea endophytica TaxID=1654476 RepID=A0A9X2VIX5_9PSEU|nr:hypothetical protein [Umezawaea endophytica]MCS7476964.1 hypothetical protein [Umezawaea endophytica]
MGAESELLDQLCGDLRLMWRQAGGPSLRALAGRVRLSKSQIGAILTGTIRRPPAWDTVRGLVESFRAYAEEYDATLSVPTGVSEFWKPRHTVLEYAFSHARAVPDRTPRQLPPAVRLCGRATELRELAVLSSVRRRSAVAVVVRGAAGVGKTALAVGWAHRIRDRFPDGQLFADLHGSTRARPADPAETLRGFLADLGARTVPNGLAALSACYRSALAGRRVLVVLDDARDTEQVLPLLPGTPGSVAVVTSRDRLSRLVAAADAHTLLLGPLTRTDAAALLATRLGRPAVSPALAEIISRSGGLPGALAMAAETWAG